MLRYTKIELVLTPHPQSLISEFSLSEMITELSTVVTSTEELVTTQNSIGIPYHLRVLSYRVVLAESTGEFSEVDRKITCRRPARYCILDNLVQTFGNTPH